MVSTKPSNSICGKVTMALCTFQSNWSDTSKYIPSTLGMYNMYKITTIMFELHCDLMVCTIATTTLGQWKSYTGLSSTACR